MLFPPRPRESADPSKKGSRVHDPEKRVSWYGYRAKGDSKFRAQGLGFRV